MTDPRSTPNGAWITSDTAAQIGVPLIDILRSPDGPRDRQLVLGDPVTVLGTQGAHSYIRSGKDGYHGFIATTAITAPTAPTHRITAAASHCYAEANMKSPDLMALSFGATLTALSETEKFIETAHGFIPKQHIRDANITAKDPAEIAELFLGVPYLWGGNSHTGIDCSGLVQTALLACAIPCQGDSDQQEKTLAPNLPPNTAPQRNDVMFWKGHVALVTDETTLIHANAHHMATTYEPIKTALARIAATEGPCTAHKRLAAFSW